MKNKIVSCVVVLVLAWILLRYAPQVASGVATGLSNSATLLIPSLFPFMILAAFVGATETGVELSRWIGMILHPITGLPKAIGASFFMSFLGGFPVGAQMLSRQLEQGEIDRRTTEKALCCCVNAGPSFLIGTVGMLFHPKAGVMLLISQICSSLCIATALFRFDKYPESSPRPRLGRDALVTSIRTASMGMFGICAFVTAFSALTALLKACGIFDITAELLAATFPQQNSAYFAAALSGILEVTNGCIAAASLPQGLKLTAFLVSFSSLSIVFQVKSCFQTELSFRQFYVSRIFHGILTCIFFSLFMRLFPSAISAASLAGASVSTAEPNTFASAICLIAMCTILFLAPSKVCRKR